jgi:hypothetical protein
LAPASSGSAASGNLDLLKWLRGQDCPFHDFLPLAATSVTEVNRIVKIKSTTIKPDIFFIKKLFNGYL